MSTSQRTLEQVRSILGKLDRDIDAARARRLSTGPAAATVAALAARSAAAENTAAAHSATSFIPPSPMPVPAARPASSGPAIGANGRVLATRVERRPDSPR